MGETYDRANKKHPDMVPYSQVGLIKLPYVRNWLILPPPNLNAT